MCFYLKALFCYPLIPITPQSFPITFIHSFQTLKFLPNSKIPFQLSIFFQTLKFLSNSKFSFKFQNI